MYHEENIKASKKEKDLKDQSLASPSKTPYLIQTVSGEVLEFSNLTPAYADILDGLLVLKERFNNNIWMSLETLEELLGWDEKTIRNAIKEFIRRGFLRKIRRFNDSCIYIFNEVFTRKSTKAILGKIFTAFRKYVPNDLAKLLRPDMPKKAVNTEEKQNVQLTKLTQLTTLTNLTKKVFLKYISSELTNLVSSSKLVQQLTNSTNKHTNLLTNGEPSMYENQYRLYEERFLALTGFRMTAEQRRQFYNFPTCELSECLDRLDSCINTKHIPLKNPFAYLCGMVSKVKNEFALNQPPINQVGAGATSSSIPVSMSFQEPKKSEDEIFDIDKLYKNAQEAIKTKQQQTKLIEPENYTERQAFILYQLLRTSHHVTWQQVTGQKLPELPNLQQAFARIYPKIVNKQFDEKILLDWFKEVKELDEIRPTNALGKRIDCSFMEKLELLLQEFCKENNE